MTISQIARQEKKQIYKLKKKKTLKYRVKKQKLMYGIIILWCKIPLITKLFLKINQKIYVNYV